MFETTTQMLLVFMISDSISSMKYSSIVPLCDQITYYQRNHINHINQIWIWLKIIDTPNRWFPTIINMYYYKSMIYIHQIDLYIMDITIPSWVMDGTLSHWWPE